MRKYLSLIFCAVILSSCLKQFEDLATFELEYTTQATVRSTVGINLPFDVNTPPVETNSQARFENNNTRSNLVESVNLKSLIIELTSPQGADFSFLEDITFYIDADGQNEIQIAIKDPIPTDQGNTISLDVSNENLRDYITKNAFDLRIKVTIDEAILQDHSFEVVTVFDVKAKLFN